MIGWLTIDRALMSHWCSSDPNFLAVWIWLLSEANWKDKKALINSRVIEMKRGQLIYGREAFSRKCGVSISKLRKIINVLQKEGMIDQQKTNKYTIITITKYEEYQGVDQQNTNRTPTEHQQTTTPKQDKQSNKVNKRKKAKASRQHVDPHEIMALWNNKGLGKLTEMPHARRQKINSRTKEKFKDLKAWDDYFQMFIDSHFLSGKSGNWKATFDWALNPTNMCKVLEGNYNNDAGGFDPVEYNRRKREMEKDDV